MVDWYPQLRWTMSIRIVGVRVWPMPLAPLRERGDDREGIGTGLCQDVLVPGTSPVLIRHASQQSSVDHGAQPFAQHIVRDAQLFAELLESSYPRKRLPSTSMTQGRPAPLTSELSGTFSLVQSDRSAMACSQLVDDSGLFQARLVVGSHGVGSSGRANRVLSRRNQQSRVRSRCDLGFHLRVRVSLVLEPLALVRRQVRGLRRAMERAAAMRQSAAPPNQA